MTAPQPRPRVVTAAFWCWVVAAVLLVVRRCCSRLTGQPAALFRGWGRCSPRSGSGWAFWPGGPASAMSASGAPPSRCRWRSWSLLALFALYSRGPVWLLMMILTMVGAVLMMRPPAQEWFANEESQVTDSQSAARGPVLRAGRQLVVDPGGPRRGIAMALIQLSAGYGIQWLVPGIFFVLVTGFLWIQVKAARIHTSVELTPDHLRQGEERISIDDIVRIYPEASGAETPKWQSSRALGELTGVPRGRKGIGLKLTNDRAAQAWARKHHALARRADPGGRGTHPARAGVVKGPCCERTVAPSSNWCWRWPPRSVVC